MSEAPTTPNSTPASTPASSSAAEGGGAPSSAAAPSLADTLGLNEPAGSPAAPAGEPAPSGAESNASEGASVDGEATPPAPAPDNADTPPTAEAYTFNLPEGFAPDDAVLTSARTTFAELGIPVDKAQSLIDLFVTAQTNAQSAATTAFETQLAANMTTINSMPEFQGPTRETSLQAIGALLDQYGPEAKAGILSNPAVGNDPQLTRFILNVAQALAEGSPAAPGRPAPNGRDGRSLAQQSLAERLGFSNDPPN